MPNRRLPLFFFVFAVSGFSGLIYESIWTHYLKLFLGHAAYAQSLVLAIFMGGMAAGSWLCGRYSSRWGHLLRGYALAEAVIGVLALAFQAVFERALEFSYITAIPALSSTSAIVAYKWTLSALLILPASILLGMTFPLMSAGILREFPDRPGRSIGMLYFTNSMGAALGVLASGFLLVRTFGLPGTMRLAGLLNLALAGAVWLLARDPGAAGATTVAARSPSQEPTGHSNWTLLLLVSFVTGVSSFLYEIGWIRMLSLVLGTTTHAFELMLSAFILGLAFGGLFIQRRIDAIARPLRFLAVVQVLMGLLALSTLPIYGQTFDVMRWIVRNLERSDTGYLLFNLSSNAIALVVMLPTTFFAGMTLPLITTLLLRRGMGERSIGATYAANTIGAITGVIVAVHVGLPMLGLKGLLVLGGALDLGLGVLLLWKDASGQEGRSLRIGLTVTSVAAVVGTIGLVHLDPYKMASGIYRKGEFIDPNASRLLFHQDGKTATVSVLSDILGSLSIRTNGKSDSAIAMRPEVEPTMDEYTTGLSAILPIVHRPQARSVAVIGLGTGMTTHTLLAHPGLERVDTIEIEQEMVEGAKRFRPRVDFAFSDPRGRIHIDDAKTFISSQRRTYDILVSEPSNPWVSGIAGLFSREYYQLARRNLASDGILLQWIQAYEIDLPLVASILEALSREFGDFAIYAANDMDLLVVATPAERLPEPDVGTLATPSWRPTLQRLGIRDAGDLAIRKIATRAMLSGWLASGVSPANSDYFPVLDQGAGRARFLGSNAQELLHVGRGGLPVLEMLSRQPPPSGESRVTPTRYFAGSRAAANAIGLRDYFRTGQVRGGAMPDAFVQQSSRLTELLAESDPRASEERVGLLFNLSVSMTPYLSPQEMEAFWSSVESSPSYRTAPALERLWIGLLSAVGRRDGAAMVEASSRVLQNGSAMPESARRYALAAGMLGARAVGAPEQARALWSTHGAGLPPSADGSLLFQLLGAPRARG